MASYEVIDLTLDDDEEEIPIQKKPGASRAIDVIDLTLGSEKPKKKNHDFFGAAKTSFKSTPLTGHDLSAHERMFIDAEKREKEAAERKLKYSTSSSASRTSSVSSVSVPVSPVAKKTVLSEKNKISLTVNPMTATSASALLSTDETVKSIEMVKDLVTRPATVNHNASSSSSSTGISANHGNAAAVASAGSDGLSPAALSFLAYANKKIAERTPQKTTPTSASAIAVTATPVVSLAAAKGGGVSTSINAAQKFNQTPSPDMTQYTTPKQQYTTPKQSVSKSITAGSSSSSSQTASASLSVALSKALDRLSSALAEVSTPKGSSGNGGGGGLSHSATSNSSCSKSTVRMSSAQLGSASMVTTTPTTVNPAVTKTPNAGSLGASSSAGVSSGGRADSTVSGSGGSVGRKRSSSSFVPPENSKDAIEILNNSSSSNNYSSKEATPTSVMDGVSPTGKKHRYTKSGLSAISAATSAASDLSLKPETAARNTGVSEISAVALSAQKPSHASTAVSPDGSAYWTAVESPNDPWKMKIPPMAVTKATKKAKRTKGGNDSAFITAVAAISGKRVKQKVNYNEEIASIVDNTVIESAPANTVTSRAIASSSSSSSRKPSTTGDANVSSQLVKVLFIIENRKMFVPEHRLTSHTRTSPLTASFCFAADDYKVESPPVARASAAASVGRKSRAKKSQVESEDEVSTVSFDNQSSGSDTEEYVETQKTSRRRSSKISTAASDASTAAAAAVKAVKEKIVPEKGKKNAPARRKTSKTKSNRDRDNDDDATVDVVDVKLEGTNHHNARSTVGNGVNSSSGSKQKTDEVTADDRQYLADLLQPPPAVQTYWSSLISDPPQCPSPDVRSALLAHRRRTVGSSVSTGLRRVPLMVMVNDLHALLFPNRLLDTEEDDQECDSNDYKHLVICRTVRRVPVKDVNVLERTMRNALKNKDWLVYGSLLHCIQNLLRNDQIAGEDVGRDISASICGWNDEIPDVCSAIQIISENMLRDKNHRGSLHTVGHLLCELNRQLKTQKCLSESHCLSVLRWLLKLRSNSLEAKSFAKSVVKLYYDSVDTKLLMKL